MRRLLSRTALASLALLSLLVTAGCGPIGALDPSESPSPSSSPSADATATPVATPTAGPTESPAPAATPAPAAEPRTPPTLPPRPMPSITATEVPTVGPEPQYGSRYDSLVTCDPGIPMWLDDGDGQYTGASTDRWIACEQGQVAIIAMSVRFEEARLLTLYEEDLGVPLAHRTLTLTGFDAAAVDAVRAATGANEVDVRLSCYEGYIGFLELGDRFANCMEAYDVATLTDVPLADALGDLGIGPSFERNLDLLSS